MTGVRARSVGFTALVLLLLALGTMFAARQRDAQAAFDIGDYGAGSIEQAEQAFQEGGTNESLLLLLKALCYRQEALGEADWKEKIAYYGGELYARAKAGSVDLEKADEERVMLQLLKVLREAGA